VCSSPRVTNKQNPIQWVSNPIKAHKFASIPNTQFLLLVKQTNRKKNKNIWEQETSLLLCFTCCCWWRTCWANGEVEWCLHKAGTSSTPKKVSNLGLGTESWRSFSK
jgi:hypothetical protein